MQVSVKRYTWIVDADKGMVSCLRDGSPWLDNLGGAGGEALIALIEELHKYQPPWSAKMAMSCPFCVNLVADRAKAAAVEMPSFYDHDGVQVKVKVYYCRECNSSWLPFEEEQKIEEASKPRVAALKGKQFG